MGIEFRQFTELTKKNENSRFFVKKKNNLTKKLFLSHKPTKTLKNLTKFLR